MVDYQTSTVSMKLTIKQFYLLLDNLSYMLIR